ncbi:hypothetical protein B0H14DRAFT_3725588 [Mycena olivaceomarginata]|nr:hypothetical protein B0H14DRAFT_3725588 [Mycena olivaceomarginata]
MSEAPPRRSRSQRPTRSPLSADLAIVPLVDRPDHPGFQVRVQMTSDAEDLEGDGRTLTSLQGANNVYFQDSLTKLEEILGQIYFSSAAQTRTVQTDEVILTIYVGLKNSVTGTTTSIVLTPRLPFALFITQIIKAVWQSSKRIQAFTAKWTYARIFVACSRRLVYIDDPHHNSPSVGFSELGRFKDLVGDMEDVVGGILDVQVPAVMEEEGSSSVKKMRELYEVRGPGQSFSIYFYYMDDTSFAAGLAVAGLSPIRPVASTSFLTQPLTAQASEAQPQLHSIESVHAYLEDASDTIRDLALCRAIGGYNFGAAYKMYATVRLIPQIMSALKGVWPKTGVPTKPWAAAQSPSGLVLTFDQLLSYCKAPSSGTFANHLGWVKHAQNAIQLVQNELEAGRLNQAEDSRDITKYAASLHHLIPVALLDPSSPNFSIPKEYEDIVTVSIADTKNWVAEIETRFGKTKRGGTRRT